MKISSYNILRSRNAEIRLSVVRDEIIDPVYEYDTLGIIARLLYDADIGATNITLYLYAKGGNTNTFGTELDSIGPMTFVPGATLELFVDKDSASVAYNGTNYCTGTHTNLDLDHWPNGAVCVVEAEDVSGGNTVFGELYHIR